MKSENHNEYEHNNLTASRSAHGLKVAGLGELLWDVFPDSRQFGGAPANFAAHCRALGAESAVISAVGQDAAGDEALAILNRLGVDTSRVARDAKRPTGEALISMHKDGSHSFEIVEGAAWDHLESDESLAAFLYQYDAVCFGSLAQRSEVNRNSYQELLAAAPDSLFRVFDINLRQHYYSPRLISQSLSTSDFLKLNEDELTEVAALFDLKGEANEWVYEVKRCDRDLSNELVEKGGALVAGLTHAAALVGIALTLGERGSLIHHRGESSYEAVRKGQVVDTVGAGDSFTAGLITSLLKGHSLSESHRRASLLASRVCAHRGAVPPLPENLFDL